MMEKTFDPAAVESRIAKLWDDAQAFRAGRPERVDAPPYSIVIPPPNVTGSLHMGHAFNNTLQDILARFERMRGKDVLWQPGTDHAGIATQMVVERQLAERQQPGRREMGREAFLARVWEWKAESGGTIVNQLKRIGASCDWSRERFTMDEGLSKAVLKVFVELHRQGLIYKDKRLVNWDPQLLTAISDIEVQQIEVKGHLWYFNYPLQGEIYDPENADTFITVATTRPETMLGDVAVAVHPENERLKHLIGRNAVLPLVGRIIPIVGDDYADPEKGTGAVKITPAHDFNDFEVGRRHNLLPINILDQEAKLLLQGNADFLEGAAAGADLDAVLAMDGAERFAARKQIVAMMEARNLCPKIEPNVHTVPHGDRSGVVIEPWLTDQWYVDAKTLAQPALAAVRDGRTRFVPKNYEKTYFDWLENIQPWCISRQLWWGHQIPAWYSAWGGVYVEESEEEAVAAALADAVTREVYDDVEAGRIAQDPDQWKLLLTRDEDVLDTWFSSALWPFSTLGWPEDKDPALKRFYPTSVLVTGFDIIFFWVARMMMMGLHFMGEIPFHDIYMHALVRDEKGAKMSKSKGNVIDPLNLIDTYGADALRFTLAAMAVQGRDIKLSTQRVEGYRNFATKLWNASRFAEMNGCVRTAGFDPADVKETLNKWIVGELAQASAEVTAAIEAYKFNEAAAAAYRFVWNIFCDWYVELSKPVLQGDEDGPAKAETRATTAFLIDEIAKLLHPFMPFITEELWAIKGEDGPQRESILALAPWPDFSGLENPAAEAELGFVVDLISEIRSVRSEMNVPAGAQMPLVLVGVDADVRRRAGLWDATIKRLARASDISFADVAPPESAQMIVRGTVAALPLAGVVDIAAEKTRLMKEIAKEEGEVRKVDAKLNNADFVRRAPEEVVEENRERREDALSRIGKLTAALERLQ
ncbi:valine--tRNA ligase [Roseiarcaceae bacterium H3SJ34-1]|uniref:valine--tRNA ligase n=1 Tax=Terripilifer ovatus TaxID=3032367 RepID=UPI003AB92174|nr:valine--tRNA ligase [Roseiarcaceae bacterium H3SJ34-1]